MAVLLRLAFAATVTALVTRLLLAGLPVGAVAALIIAVALRRAVERRLAPG